MNRGPRSRAQPPPSGWRCRKRLPLRHSSSSGADVRVACRVRGARIGPQPELKLWRLCERVECKRNGYAWAPSAQEVTRLAAAHLESLPADEYVAALAAASSTRPDGFLMLGQSSVEEAQWACSTLVAAATPVLYM